MDKLALKNKLNSKQLEAALYDDGHAVVFAGAGSGKTRVITARIARLVADGCKASRIMAVTFTNRAATEMRQRVLAWSPFCQAATIGTFHSICARWLREFADELGFESDFLIYDDADVKSTLKKLVKDKVQDRNEITVLVDELKTFISFAKTNALLPSDIEKNKRLYEHLIPVGGVEYYRKFQETLAASNAMDFSDLLLNVLLLLRTNSKVRSTLQKRYLHILVDEYQDTNGTQFEMLEFLTGDHTTMFVVGDDDQSIYSWRGANPSNILDFQKHFKGAKLFKLEQNYRSTGNIVDASSAMIACNEQRVDKKVWTESPAGEQIDYILESDGEMEGWSIVESITREKRVYPYTDVAIFYRTNSQSRLIEDALRSEDIPYKIYGGTKFYDRMEIKDLMAYLRLLVSPKDDVGFRRIVNVPPRKIGKKTQQDLQVIATAEGISLMECLGKQIEEKTKLAKKFGDFYSKMQEYAKLMRTNPMHEILEELIKEIDYLSYLDKKYHLQYEDKVANVHELVIALEDFSAKHPKQGLSDWLQSVTLNNADGEESQGISLMTLHSAKGLEFRRVYIGGVEDGLVPHANNVEDKELLEEERRLFYVGITRAMEKLSLYGVVKRRGYQGWVANPPSRFLDEIPEKFVECDPSAAEAMRMKNRQYAYEEEGSSYDYDDIAESEAIVLRVGAKVHHPTYGKGLIKEILSEGVRSQAGLKVKVSFDDFGIRKIYAHHLE